MARTVGSTIPDIIAPAVVAFLAISMAFIHFFAAFPHVLFASMMVVLFMARNDARGKRAGDVIALFIIACTGTYISFIVHVAW